MLCPTQPLLWQSLILLHLHPAATGIFSLKSPIFLLFLLFFVLLDLRPRMRSHMGVQVARPVERLVAFTADVRLYLKVVVEI